jgi:hypothetical protein
MKGCCPGKGRIGEGNALKKLLKVFYAISFVVLCSLTAPEISYAGTLLSSNNLGTQTLGPYESFTFNAGSGSYIYGFSLTTCNGSYALYVGTQAGQGWSVYEGSLGASGFNGGGYITFSTLGSTHDLQNLLVYTATDVADTATVIQARDAASAANVMAGQARASADAARDYAAEARNEILYGTYNGGKSLGLTYDRANESSLRTWDTLTSKSAATLAREARDNAGAANIKLNTLETAIANINTGIATDVSTPTVKIKTLSGAAATSGSSIRAVVDVSDNQSKTFIYSLDNVTYIPLPGNGLINLPVINAGPNLIAMWVKDEGGNASKVSIVIRRL